MNPLDYFRESGSHVIEKDWGWANYFINDKECYIEIVYIDKEHRRKRKAFELGEEITRAAKEMGCEYLTTTIATNRDGVERSMSLLVAFGFKYAKADQKALWFIKEI